VSVPPVLSSTTAVEHPGPGPNGEALSPPDSRPVVVMPLSSTMLVIRSAVLIACLVLVPGMALVGVSWLDRFTTQTTAENDALAEEDGAHGASELDELQQLAGMTGVAKERAPQQHLRIAPSTVPAFFGEQTPAQKPYWEQDNAVAAHGEVEAAVAQAQVNPRITGVTMANEAGVLANFAANPYTASQQAVGQHLQGQPSAGHYPAPSQDATQTAAAQQATNGLAAAPRRPWASRGMESAAQATPRTQPMAQAQAASPSQAASQPYATAQPFAEPQVQEPSASQAAVQQVAMQTEGVAHVAAGPQPPLDQQGVLQAMIARLRGMGAAYFRLENWGQVSYFRCEMPLPDNPRYHAYFEATNADPIAAVREVLEKIEKWQQQAAGTVIAAPPQQPGSPLHR